MEYIFIMTAILCDKKAKEKEKELVAKVIHELPYDVVYHIYGYCPRKKVFIDHSMTQIKYFVFYMGVVNVSSYFLGSLITQKKSYGTVFLNLVIGYLMLSMIGGFALMVHFVFESCMI